MALYDREYDSRLPYGNRINPLVILLAINMIIFVTLAFFKALVYLRFPEGGAVNGFFDNNILSWFALSNKPIVVTRPWTIFTYAFVHLGVWNLFANMLWLWAFGYVLIDLTGTRNVAPIYIYGAVMSAMAFILCTNILPVSNIQSDSHLYFGAGASVMAIALAATTVSPNYKILPMLGGGIPVWFITLLFVSIDLATIPLNNPSIHISHITGGITGFLIIFLLKRGYDMCAWMNNFYDWSMNLFNPDKPARKQNFKNTLFCNSSSVPYKSQSKITQQKIDDILDKINREGVNKLSLEEKEFLQRVGSEEIKDK
jgi:membrane associated rhomboid family serine protease